MVHSSVDCTYCTVEHAYERMLVGEAQLFTRQDVDLNGLQGLSIWNTRGKNEPLKAEK